MTDVAQYSRKHRLIAWGVHAFTMSGVVWACLALLSFANGSIKMMWLWLAVALIVDGVDGSMARKAKVKEVVPWFDGTVLDYIVDYLTWTFIPAIFMYRFLPLGPKPLAMTMMILVCVSSMFCYCNEGEKSKDHYFVGFPAAWNIVALYFYLLGTPAWFNVTVTIFFAIITLSTFTFVHPFRVVKFMVVNIVMTAAWVGIAIALVIMHPGTVNTVYPIAPVDVYQTIPIWLLILWWVPFVWFLVLGIWRTAKGKPLD